MKRGQTREHIIFVDDLEDDRPLTNFSIFEVCLHPNQITEVVSCVCNCETTVQVCLDCDKVLTEPKTDCR